MSQQLAIIVMVDIESALKAKTLKGNTYLFDNMKLQGSENEGTGDLITAVNGTRWGDGSVADEPVLNWLPYGVGSMPPSLPKTFQADQAKASDTEALAALADLANRIENTEKNNFKKLEDVVAELKSINERIGVNAKTKSKHQGEQSGSGTRIMDVTGKLLSATSEDKAPEASYTCPIITDITGEAVDKKIIYPAEYGSPDLATDGWYWSATVDTSRPGIYAYTMHIQVYGLVFENGAWVWEPVDLTYDSYLKVTQEPKKNGFTNAGVGILPIV